MTAKQVLSIKVLNCGGLRDLMSELEASFLVSALGLFRNRIEFGRGKPRANVDLDRAYDSNDFYRSVVQPTDILHLIAHSNDEELEVGIAKKRVTPTGLVRQVKRSKSTLAPVVISTGCRFQSTPWQNALRNTGVRILIAANGDVSPANLTAFDMAFYSALLSQIRKKTPTDERVRESFKLAYAYYRSLYPRGTRFAKFSLVDL